MNLSRQRAEALLEALPAQRVLVLGDLMLDRYVHGEVERISPEAPVPVVHVHSERAVAGGACNVAMNLRALGAQAELTGVVGNDAAGEELRGILEGEGVQCQGVVVSDKVRTITKTRVLAGAGMQQICRVDREGNGFGGVAERAFVAERLDTCAAVVIEDYGKGTVTPALTRRVLDRAADAGIASGVDPKANLGLDFHGATVVKPNRREALHLAGLEEHRAGVAPLEDEALLEAGRILRQRWDNPLLLVTLGGDGLLLFGPGPDEVRHVPTHAREVFDVSGAGDTVIATYMAARAAGADEMEAAQLANVAAGVVVAKVGTATCSPREILEALA